MELATQVLKKKKLTSGERVPAAVTDTGCERTLNEDRYAVVDSPSGTAWVVCDGMGGVSGGELAAQLSIETIRRSLELETSLPAVEALESALTEANKKILFKRQNQAFAQMGTTVVAMLMQGQEVAISHLGDSRSYLIRNSAIQQLTTDHTLVQDLVDKGEITIEESLSHPEAHVLTRCLGAESVAQIETKSLWIWESIEKGDSVLLCSDGLYSLVDDTEIAEKVSAYEPQEACLQLIELAKARGGYDNITVAIIPINGELRSQAPPTFNAKKNLEKLQRGNLAKKEKKPPKWGRLITSIVLLTILSGVIAALLALIVSSIG